MRTEVIGNATLYLADCREWLAELPEAYRVDAVLTDPPFGVGNFVQTTGRLLGRGKRIGQPVNWNESTPDADVFAKLRAISQHRIIWGANYFNCFEQKGGALVWLKKQPMPNFSKAEIASCTRFKKTEVIEIPWTNGEVGRFAKTDHPCERPVSLYEWCINFLPECESFLDPYMGSASVGHACVNLRKKYIGIEINPEYFDIACQRIDQAQRQQRMFA